MILREPIWLLLAAPLLVAMWLWPPATSLLRILRALIFILLLLALAGLTVLLPSRSGTVIIAVDRSLSIPPGGEQVAKDTIRVIQDSARGDSRTGVISFGRDSVTEMPPSTAAFTGFTGVVDAEASDVNAALEAAMSFIPASSPGRILLLTDGQWTGTDPAKAAAKAAARGIAIDYRMFGRRPGMDTAIASLDAPGSVEPEEAFMLVAWVSSPASQNISYELRRNDSTIAAGTSKVTAGLNRLLFRDRAPSSGTCEYVLSITGEGEDSIPGNNAARALIGVAGHRSLLCVSQSPASGLARSLSRAGLDVDVQTAQQCKWRLEDLSSHSAILLENVPAQDIGQEGMLNLAAWVRESGNGLMTTGGKSAYALGGYYRSPLESVLPVSMELKREHRKLSLAIVVAMDRSGSMAMAAGGGRTKIQLASEGAAQVLDLMSPLDEFGVVAVDSSPHIVVNLADAENAKKYRGKILSVESEGGGIFVYTALQTAANMIRSAKAGTKHIILFADAADSEEPGDYKQLISQLRAAGVTVSVIGLGTPQDQDAKFIEDVAKRGGGRIEFTNDPGQLPRLFAQETFIVARNTFVEDTTPIKATGALVSLTGRQFELSSSLGGYNLCYLRPDAQMGAVTKDEYAAPVVAAWSCGAGRVLSYTGEADGKFTGPIGGWPQVGDFYASLARWAMGGAKSLPGGSMLTQRVHEGVSTIELHLDPGRADEPFSGVPAVTVLRGKPGREPAVEHPEMRWTDPDTLAVDVPLTGAETALAAVTVPGWAPVSLPPVCLAYSPEYLPAAGAEAGAKLREISQATGGRERVDLGDIWRDIPPRPRYIPLAGWLLLAAVVLLLIEVLERRTRFVSALRFSVEMLRREGAAAPQAAAKPLRERFSFVRRLRKKAETGAAKPREAADDEPTPAPKPAPASAPAKPEKPKKEPQPKPEPGVLDAMRRASQEARHRTKRD